MVRDILGSLTPGSTRFSSDNRTAMFGCQFTSFGVSAVFSAEAKADEEDSLDFSQPWQFSDVVLVVEEDRFHVHRNILGMWSEVFTTMFTSQFKEKTAEEVPLPGKKSAEIKEMLLVIYPTSAKPIDKSNYGFLLSLAKEYMMTKLTKKCENFLMYGYQKPYGIPKMAPLCSFLHCLDLLDIAQNYGLERLTVACTEKAKDLSLTMLRKHEIFRNEKIKFANYRAIVEGKIEKLEGRIEKLEVLEGKMRQCKTCSKHAAFGTPFLIG